VAQRGVSEALHGVKRSIFERCCYSQVHELRYDTHPAIEGAFITVFGVYGISRQSIVNQTLNFIICSKYLVIFITLNISMINSKGSGNLKSRGRVSRSANWRVTPPDTSTQLFPALHHYAPRNVARRIPGVRS
jgi:hypothetical protein